MKKILVICPYPRDKAPSQRLKYEQYFSSWEKEGYQITVEPFINESFWSVVYRKGFYLAKIYHTIISYMSRLLLLFSIRKYDIVYVHLWATPFGFPLYEFLMSLLAKKMIYDIDDMVFLYNPSQASPLVSVLKGHKKPIYLMKKADHVIVCTPKLAQFASKYNKHITDISSTINTDTYLPINDYSNNRILTIGWSGSHSTSKYLKILSKVLIEIQTETKVNILVIGDSDFRIEGLKMECISWNLKEEVTQLQRIDIGLYPLPDEEWVYGKSGLKALQYMALGIPTIARAIGANFRVIDNDLNGYLVDLESEWKQKILYLMTHSEERKRLGLAARQKVIQEYSIHANKEKYLNIFKSIG